MGRLFSVCIFFISWLWLLGFMKHIEGIGIFSSKKKKRKEKELFNTMNEKDHDMCQLRDDYFNNLGVDKNTRRSFVKYASSFLPTETQRFQNYALDYVRGPQHMEWLLNSLNPYFEALKTTSTLCLVKDSYVNVTISPKTFFNGISCHPFSCYPEGCLYPSSCIPGSTCVLWKEGTLSIPSLYRTGNKAEATTLQEFKAIKLKKLLRVMDHTLPCSETFYYPLQSGRYLKYASAFSLNKDHLLSMNLAAIPSSKNLLNMNTSSSLSLNSHRTKNNICSVLPVTPFQMHYLFHNHIIVFIGDSLVRQLFNRLVFHLRGFSEVGDHYYHLDAVYVRNNTHDSFRILARYIDAFDVLNNRDAFEAVKNPTLMVYFIWGGFNTTVVDHLFSSVKPHQKKVIVTGLHYWLDTVIGHTELSESYLPYLEDPKVSFFWYPVSIIWKNNLKMLRNNFYSCLVPLFPSSYVLPFYEMFLTDPEGRMAHDTAHYQCTYKSQIFQPIVANQLRTPPSKDCHDYFNLNMIYVMSNILLSQEVSTLI
jgi:hypothetical protein